MLIAESGDIWSQWGPAGALAGVLVLFLLHLVKVTIPRMEDKCAENLARIAAAFSTQLDQSRTTFREELALERNLFREDGRSEKVDRERALEMLLREIQAAKEESHQARLVATHVRDAGCKSRADCPIVPRPAQGV